MHASICLTDDHHWAVATADTPEPTILVVGRPFQPGADIRDALAEMEAWARQHDYELITDHYAVGNWALEDLIEPEIYEQILGHQAVP